MIMFQCNEKIGTFKTLKMYVRITWGKQSFFLLPNLLNLHPFLEHVDHWAI